MDNERGDIGVGTLIIFIAMVLVAAVAATVLIYTTGALQQKASKTSKEATQQISTNIIVEQVLGNRSSSAISYLDNGLIIRVKPDVGTTSIDLRQMIITVWDKDSQYDLNYSDTEGLNNTFTATVVRDEDHSFNSSTPVLNSGDLVKIVVTQAKIGAIQLTTRKTFWITMNLELGSPVNLEITTPNSFGVNRYVMLYP
ncbi:MAG: archaellin/type IV pilin N-terminal domain-containing protein [Candidatus Methanoperedens sp.]